jgi:hypothetical protein
MNPQEQFIPAWVGSVLSKQPSTQPVENVNEEVRLLRAFFKAWDELHAKQNLPAKVRKEKHDAMIAAVNALKELNNGN